VRRKPEVLAQADKSIGEPALPPSADQSLADLFRQHNDDLVRLAYLLTGVEATAEDLVQDVFARLSRAHVDMLQPDAYLRRCVVNAARSWHRRRRVERRHLHMQVPETVSLEAHEFADALGVLKARERAVIVLHYYEDRSIDEIATILECPRGTVASLQSRALDRLRKVIER
jgi:RNA polymerase sigma factor (sigma-70 family)